MANTFANTQDLVDIESVHDNTVVMRGGRLLKILMVDGVNFSLKSEEEQNLIVFAYQNFLNGIEFPVQIVIHSRKVNLDKYLGGLEAREREEPSGLLKSQIAEYREFIRSFVAENPIMNKTFFVMVPFTPLGIPQVSGLSKFLPFKKSSTPAEAVAKAKADEETAFRQSLSQLDQRANQVTEGLRGIGLAVKMLDDEELVELFYNFYNPETTEKEDLPIAKKPAREPNL